MESTKMKIQLDGKEYETKEGLEAFKVCLEGKKYLRAIDFDNANETVGNAKKEKESFDAFGKLCNLIFTTPYEGRTEFHELPHMQVAMVISFFYSVLAFNPMKN